MKKIIYRLSIVVLIGIFCFSAYQVGSYYYESMKYQKHNSELINQIDDDQDGKNQAKEKPFKLKYADLLKQNSDFIGWIEIADTKINYPVMYTPNNPEYYLRRNFDKEYEFRGTIFVGENTDLEKPSDNIILYGHNMDDQTMFGPLRSYKKKDYYLKHPLIRFETQRGNNQYEIFSVFRTVDNKKHDLYIDYYRFIDASSENEFNTYVHEFITRSYYDTGIIPEYGDELLTLSTCEYSENNGRLVVVARKVEETKQEES